MLLTSPACPYTALPLSISHSLHDDENLWGLSDHGNRWAGNPVLVETPSWFWVATQEKNLREPSLPILSGETFISRQHCNCGLGVVGGEHSFMGTRFWNENRCGKTWLANDSTLPSCFILVTSDWAVETDRLESLLSFHRHLTRIFDKWRPEQREV